MDISQEKMFRKEKLKVLIVDDEIGIQTIMSRLLSKDGFITDTAGSGAEAMWKLKNSHFDLVITDVIMPEGSGLELLERMRMLYPGIISIVISASKDLNAIIKAIRLGASGFILKPFRLEEVRLALSAALENRKIRERHGRMQILTMLMEAGKDITAALDISTLSTKIVEYARMIADADTASLLLLNGEQRSLWLAGASGLDTRFSPGYRIPIDASISGWALQRCFCLNMKKGEIISPELKSLLRRETEIHSSICMPIFIDNSPLGVLNVARLSRENAVNFDRSDVDFLSILSSHAAVCLKNSDLFKTIQQLYEGSIQALLMALRAKDKYTGEHSQRVARFAQMIAEHMGLTHREIQEIWTAGILHDIGKIGTPEQILNKPTVLNGSEWKAVQNHPSVGADIVRSIPGLKHIAPIVLHHHEWFDGTGYPDGLKGAEIPLGSRILSVADTLEAMISHRPYRQFHSKEHVLDELRKGKSRQFDPEIIDHVIALIERGVIEI